MKEFITLKNDFHNTEVSVRTDFLSHGDGRYSIVLTKSQGTRVRRKLCGLGDSCTCGGVRGPQEHQGHRFFVERVH